MAKFAGRRLPMLGVPLAVLVTGVATGCSVVNPTEHVAATTKVTTSLATSADVAEPPADPTVPTLIGLPGQSTVGQAVVARSQRDQLLATASLTSIPEASLSAYQRAAQVIDAADPSCRLSWTLLAAVGQVESAVGRYGPTLNGQDGRVAVSDTDAGRIDGDAQWDRAVGPMQLLPSTWSQVAVDADGDGQRDPQDIDDASLAAAVYFCGGSEDLSTRDGKLSAVQRYNRSTPYIQFILSLSHAYALDEQTLLPVVAARTGSVVAAPLSPRNPLGTPPDVPDKPVVLIHGVMPATPVTPAVTSVAAAAPPNPGSSGPGSGSSGSGSSGSGSGSGSGSSGSGSNGSGSSDPTCPTPTPTDTPTETPTASPTPSTDPSTDPSASATPTAEPTADPTGQPTPGAVCPTPSSSPTPSASASGSASPSVRHGAHPSPSATPTASAGGSPTASPSASASPSQEPSSPAPDPKPEPSPEPKPDPQPDPTPSASATPPAREPSATPSADATPTATSAP